MTLSLGLIICWKVSQNLRKHSLVCYKDLIKDTDKELDYIVEGS